MHPARMVRVETLFIREKACEVGYLGLRVLASVPDRTKWVVWNLIGAATSISCSASDGSPICPLILQ